MQDIASLITIVMADYTVGKGYPAECETLTQ